MKISIPGLNNSGADHWQTRFENSDPTGFRRVDQESWDQPDCESWINRIENDLKGLNYSELILVGHSIGCIAILKWYEKFGHKIKGALLVAPSDSEREGYPEYIKGFTPIPNKKLPFPTTIVASDNDHVTELKRSREFAHKWGSKLVILNNAGHIESESGFGDWPLGQKLIDHLAYGNSR